MRIGVFDSGVGGLTVLKKLIDKYPNNEYIYYGDAKNIPYGEKTIEELKRLSCKIIDFLISNNVDMIVIACGTISSNIYEYLKSKYNIKIIDIISPTIDFINNSEYKKIGVLATRSTVNSKVFTNRLNKEVVEVACSNFVPLIENNRLEEVNEYFDMYLKDMKDVNLIVLGCTHYPIIRDRINSYFNGTIELFNMADAINDISNDGEGKVDLYFSKIDDSIINNVNLIIGDKFDSINLREV